MIFSFLLTSLMAWFTPTPTPVNPTACQAKQMVRKGIGTIPRGFTFLKGYPVDGKSGKKKRVEYSYILSRNSKYLITLATRNNKSEGLKITLLNARKKAIASSYVDGKYYDGIQYTCQKTGLYYIRFTYDTKKTKSYCSGGVLSFRR
ncbi:MAG TPA: hypothetical protein DCS93_33320 [Microscillaceae bacterium]|nr:hypothetical protein [Microscillaceae bacterium]